MAGKRMCETFINWLVSMFETWWPAIRLQLPCVCVLFKKSKQNWSYTKWVPKQFSCMFTCPFLDQQHSHMQCLVKRTVSLSSKHCQYVTYTFSCASQGSHTCRRWTSAGDRPWTHNDGTGCASCSGVYRKMMSPSSGKSKKTKTRHHSLGTILRDFSTS